MSLLEQIKSTTKEIDSTKKVARQSADPAMVAAQKRLAKLKQEYDERLRDISEEVRERMQEHEQLPGRETP
jgi:hypothetical protein